MNENKSNIQKENDTYLDRRMDTRIGVEMEVEFEFQSEGQIQKGNGIITFISRKGLTIKSNSSLNRNDEIVLKVELASLHVAIRPTAKVNWISRNERISTIGLEFIFIPNIYKPHLNIFLNTKISIGAAYDRRVKSEILSELCEFVNIKGKKIVGFNDHLINLPNKAPFIIIPSSYGETKINSIQASYYFAKNGFNVLRFDLSNHLGESEGSHNDYNLGNVKEDIISAIDFVQKTHKPESLALVASSLSARAAIKALKDTTAIKLFVSIVGIINVQDTFRRVQSEDLIEKYLSGFRFGETNILGFEVNGDKTIRTAIEGKYHTLESTIDDIKDVRSDILMLNGTLDPWVAGQDIEKLRSEFMSRPNVRIMEIPTMHKLKENPNEAKKTFRLIVNEVQKNLLPTANHTAIREPTIREMGVQIRLERERSKNSKDFSAEEQKSFWENYLKRFRYIYSIADYRILLDSILSELGNFKQNDSVLDAGCGNGSMGIWIINTIGQATKQTHNYPTNINYVAGDIVEEALSHSKILHRNAQNEIKEKYKLNNDFILTSYQKIDMNREIPFLDSSFDKIICNLVVSYLENPSNAIKELIRVLKSDGVLVITNLKKDADISGIYRNFIEKARTRDEINEAKNLLSNTGNILSKESEGFFRFFTEDEIKKLIYNISPSCDVKVKPCFSNQAIMAVISKR